MNILQSRFYTQIDHVLCKFAYKCLCHVRLVKRKANSHAIASVYIVFDVLQTKRTIYLKKVYNYSLTNIEIIN